jgi:hypothetical protein
MASLMSRVARFARSPQGRKMSDKAMRFAKSPEGKRKIAQARERFASKRTR